MTYSIYIESIDEEIEVEINSEINFYPGDKGDYWTPPSSDEFEVLAPTWNKEEYTEQQNKAIQEYVSTDAFIEETIKKYTHD